MNTEVICALIGRGGGCFVGSGGAEGRTHQTNGSRAQLPGKREPGLPWS